jgi:hypothetical protein
VLARNALESGHADEATRLWLSIARSPDLESRQVLQAWTFLRRQGITPGEDEAEVVHGVVCEVAVGDGHDILAVYRDGSSRYLNYSGKVVVVEGGSPSALAAAVVVIATAEPLGHEIGLWEQELLPDLPKGDARLLLLTPGGSGSARVRGRCSGTNPWRSQCSTLRLSSCKWSRICQITRRPSSTMEPWTAPL